MRELVKRIDAEFGFELTDAEIERITKEAEQMRAMCQALYEVDLSGVVPMMKIDKGEKK